MTTRKLCLGFLFLFCSVSVQDGESKKIPNWWLKVAQSQGPNACVVEWLPGTRREFWTECRYKLASQICGVKTKVRFECCAGFEPATGGDDCSGVKPLRKVLDTAAELGATKWVKYIRESGLQNELERSGAITLFVPTNEAFDAVGGRSRKQLDLHRGTSNNPILRYHVLPSKVKTKDVPGDLLVETKLSRRSLRLNKYSTGMTTVNCAPILRKDQEATNGVVHIIDGVLDPSLQISANVADVVLRDGRFGIFASMLERSALLAELREISDSLTILAPSDEAFQKLPESRLEKLMNVPEARLAVLKNHVITHSICESAITGEHRVPTVANTKLLFTCGQDGATVEGNRFRSDVIFGNNGIIHVIDDVLLPDRAKNLIEVAKSRNLDTFVDLVKRSGLEETFSRGDYTLFVPEEKAWLEMPRESVVELRHDPIFAEAMVRFHGAHGRHVTKDITDNQVVVSLDKRKPLRLQIWRGGGGVEDAKIIESDIEAENGVIHIINKVILPSSQSIEDTLNSIDEYSFKIFLEVLQEVTSDVYSVIKLTPNEAPFYTFFVPTDWAFSVQNQELLTRALRKRENMQRLLLNHVTLHMYPAVSFEPNLDYTIEGLGNEFIIKKNSSGKLRVNKARVLGSYMSSNGVIHVIDDVFLPKEIYHQPSVTSSQGRDHPTFKESLERTRGEEVFLHSNPIQRRLVGSEKRKTSFAVLQNASVASDDLPLITIYETYSTSTLHDNSTRKTNLVPYSRHSKKIKSSKTKKIYLKKPYGSPTIGRTSGPYRDPDAKSIINTNGTGMISTFYGGLPNWDENNPILSSAVNGGGLFRKKRHQRHPRRGGHKRRQQKMRKN